MNQNMEVQDDQEEMRSLQSSEEQRSTSSFADEFDDEDEEFELGVEETKESPIVSPEEEEEEEVVVPPRDDAPSAHEAAVQRLAVITVAKSSVQTTEPAPICDCGWTFAVFSCQGFFKTSHDDTGTRAAASR